MRQSVKPTHCTVVRVVLKMVVAQYGMEVTLSVVIMHQQMVITIAVLLHGTVAVQPPIFAVQLTSQFVVLPHNVVVQQATHAVVTVVV